MTAPHILRHPTRLSPQRWKTTFATEASCYPPGFFTELMRAHNWPPRFRSQIAGIEVRNVNGETVSDVARRNRERGLAEGKWSATGTIPMRGTPKDSGPLGMMR